MRGLGRPDAAPGAPVGADVLTLLEAGLEAVSGNVTATSIVGVSADPVHP